MSNVISIEDLEPMTTGFPYDCENLNVFIGSEQLFEFICQSVVRLTDELPRKMGLNEAVIDVKQELDRVHCLYYQFWEINF